MRCPFRKNTITTTSGSDFPEYKYTEYNTVTKDTAVYYEEFAKCYEDECPYYRSGRCYQIFISNEEDSHE